MLKYSGEVTGGYQLVLERFSKKKGELQRKIKQMSKWTKF